MPKLPPGQRARPDFPRFGLSQYAKRLPQIPAAWHLKITGDIEQARTITPQQLAQLPRSQQRSDFHCVTTWSKVGLQWGGVRFRDVYEAWLRPLTSASPAITHIIFRCLDGYRVMQLLEDVLNEDVLLADELNGKPLPLNHGAPLRLVAPQQYGYKNPKHMKGIELWPDDRHYQPPGFRFMDHPRARVAYEERGRTFPGWFLRYLYRPLIQPTVRQHQRYYKLHEEAA
jgi:DMSO/TMAO reductase YedYZ molybdopterin-dependent catalytic subunit